MFQNRALRQLFCFQKASTFTKLVSVTDWWRLAGRLKWYQSFSGPTAKDESLPLRDQCFSRGLPSWRLHFNDKLQSSVNQSSPTCFRAQDRSESISTVHHCSGEKNTLPLACLVTEIGQHQSESLWTLWHDFRRHLKGTETSEIMSQRCRNKGEKLRTVKSLLLWSQQAAIFGFPADRYLCEDPPTGTDNWTAVTGGRYIQPPQLTAERGGALIIPGYFHAAVLFEVISWGQICFVSKLISLGGLHLSHNLWIFKYILVQTDPSLNCCHLWLWWM